MTKTNSVGTPMDEVLAIRKQRVIDSKAAIARLEAELIEFREELAFNEASVIEAEKEIANERKMQGWDFDIGADPADM